MVIYHRRQGKKEESADSSRKMEVIIIANDDLIRWHRFQRDDEGLTSVRSTGKHKIG